MSTQGPLNIPPGYGHTPGPSAFPNHIGPIFQKTVTPPSGPVEHWTALLDRGSPCQRLGLRPWRVDDLHGGIRLERSSLHAGRAAGGDTVQDERTNIVYFGDVRIPDRYRLGEADQGMRVMHSALDLEHGGAAYHAAQVSMLKHAVAWARAARPDGSRPIEERDARASLARAAIRSAVSDVLCRRAAWADEEGLKAIAYNPMAKLFVTESLAADAADIVALAAPDSLLWDKSDLGLVEVAMRRALGMTVYGGTSEIQRSLIAEHFLKMPKTRS